MKNYILHDKENCIGCGACVAVDEDNWEMEEEGRSHLKWAEKQDSEEKKEISSEEVEKHKETAEICPVNVIHIYKDGEKLI